MKHLTIILILFSHFAFGQSVEIKPNDEKIMVSSLSETPIVIGRRGSLVGGLPSNTSINSSLLFLGARGYVDGEYRVNSAASIALRANQNFSSTANGTHILFQTTADNTTSVLERMRIAHNGNIGIGTTNPLTKLHISSGASGASPEIFSNVIIENSSHNILNLLTPDSRETGILFTRATSGNTGGINYSSANKLNFVAGGSTRMTVFNDRVGIGESTPSSHLHIKQGSFNPLFLEGSGSVDNDISFNTPDSRRAGIDFHTPTFFNNTNFTHVTAGLQFNRANTKSLEFVNNSTTYMALTTNDKIEINKNFKAPNGSVEFNVSTTGLHSTHNPDLNIAPLAVGQFCKTLDEPNISSGIIPISNCTNALSPNFHEGIVTSTSVTGTVSGPNFASISVKINLSNVTTQYQKLLLVIGDVHINGIGSPTNIDKLVQNNAEIQLNYFVPALGQKRDLNLTYIIYGIK